MVFLQKGPGAPAGRRRIHLHHPVGPRQHAQPVHVDQRLSLRRQLAEAVDDLLQQPVDLVHVLGRRQLLVEGQPQVHVAAVIVREQGGRVQLRG
jgi:hypothetical protein